MRKFGGLPIKKRLLAFANNGSFVVSAFHLSYNF